MGTAYYNRRHNVPATQRSAALLPIGPFAEYGIRFVSHLDDKRHQADIEVLIQLELHSAVGSAGMGMIRSRVISAA